MVAIQELGIISPLKEVGLTKMKYERPQKKWGFPHGINLPMHVFFQISVWRKITREKLKRVSQAEDFLRDLGFYHSVFAATGILPESKFYRRKLKGFSSKACDTTKALRSWFTYITLDMAGYRTGSMNEELKEEDRAVWKN